MNNGSSLLVRYEARSPQGQTALQHYSAAIGRMKSRPANDPTSYAYQANIHGTYSAPLPLQNQCEHESWFFFPWHRIYLFYFERIVRQAVVEEGGPADWTLPYWNYDLDRAHAALPDPFLQPADASNPLFLGGRNRGPSEGKPIPELLAFEERALALREFIGNAMFGGGNRSPHQPRFWGQPGPPEISPHGAVHVAVGGAMSDPETAAQDPIFWLHHSNIDRIWAVWNEGRGRANPTEGGWTGHGFQFFDADGSQAGKTCGEVTETKLLGYTYDPPPGGAAPTEGEPPVSPAASEPPPGAPSQPKFVGASEEPVPLTGGSVEVPVEIDPKAQEEILAASDPGDPRHLYLNVEEIRGEKTPGSVYAMYLNLPDDPKSADYDKRYVGNAAFFGIERTVKPVGDEAPHGMRISVEVGDVVRALHEDSAWNQGELRVCFRPIVSEEPGEEPEYEDHEPIEIGRVSLSIDA
jgi:tyrosinase-like protein